MALLYGNDTISMDVKISFPSRKLRKEVSGEEGDGQIEGLFARGKTEEICFEV